MSQKKDDLADLLNIFSGRYFEFVHFLRERTNDQNEFLNWKDRLDQLIDLSRVAGIFSEENQSKAIEKSNNKARQDQEKLKYDKYL